MTHAIGWNKNVPVTHAWTAFTHGPLPEPLLDYGSYFDQVAYQDIPCDELEYRVIPASEGAAYLPVRKDSVTIIAGIEKPKDITIKAQDSVSLSKQFKYKRAFVINSGGSIWGLDFAPKPPSASNQFIQYLAIAGYPGTMEEHHNVGEIQEPGTVGNCIQIWRMDLRITAPDDDPIQKPTLDLCIAHDYGIIRALRWCPYGTYQEPMDDQTFTPRLGIVAVAFGDGSIKIFSVPHPDGLRMKAKGKSRKHGSSDSPRQTVHVKLEAPLATLSIPDTCLSTLCWGGPFKLIAGCSKGTISQWNVEKAILARAGRNKDTAKDDIASALVYSVKAHAAAVREVAYHSPHDPQEHDYASCGQDGRVRCCDDRDPYLGRSYWKNRGLMQTMCWPTHSDMIFFPDVERNLRCIRTGIDNEHGVSKKLGDCRGDLWQFTSSYFHPWVAFGTSDGWFKMINNYHGHKRGERSIVINVYRMKLQEGPPKKYQYVDGIKPVNVVSQKARIGGESVYYLFLNPEIAVQQCVWNPNRLTSGWIASGGAAGLCRVEFVGVGSKWLTLNNTQSEDADMTDS